MSDLPSFLQSIKPTVDKVRAVADQIDKVLNDFDGSFLAKLVEKIPVVSEAVGVVVAAGAVLDELIDAVDGVVDANAAPAQTPPPPQASVPAIPGALP